MKLDETQKQKVESWIREGLKLSEIQNRMASELNLRLTYMEVRLLVDDLRLTPKDEEHAKPQATANGNRPGESPADKSPAEPGKDAAPGAGVSLTVDQLARPGTVVSGKVTFSGANRAEWYIDQSGRLGLVPEKQGYRPGPAELQEFQMALERELMRMGM